MRAWVLSLVLALGAPSVAAALESWPELEPRIVGQPELEAAIASARPEIDACLRAAGLRRGSVSVRLGRRSGLRVVVRSRPRDAEVERCMDTAVRAWTTVLSSETIIGRPSVTVVIRLSPPATAP